MTDPVTKPADTPVMEAARRWAQDIIDEGPDEQPQPRYYEIARALIRMQEALEKACKPCEGEESHFEHWATKERYDLHQHPLHYLFLDSKTYAARDGWRAALAYVRAALSDERGGEKS